jgi:hypothetical protein
MKIDKSPTQSKKFLAYLVSEISTKALMAWLVTHIGTLDIYETSLLLGMIISSSCLTIGYVLGQVALDKYMSAAVDILDKDEEKVKKESK